MKGDKPGRQDGSCSQEQGGKLGRQGGSGGQEQGGKLGRQGGSGGQLGRQGGRQEQPRMDMI